jgi:OmpA-OmpF porin, OOP family
MYADAQSIGAQKRILLDNENTMTHITMKQATGLAAAVALALIVFSGGASAQEAAGPQARAANSTYLRDTGGNVPLSAYGLCWHTGFGPVSPNWTEGCDPKLVPASVPLPVEPAPVAKPAAAAVAAPAPAPVDR